MNRILGLTILLIGIGLFCYSFNFEGFTNRAEFEDKVYELMDLPNKSEKFYELRNSYLTPKYELENYGFVMIIVGVAILITLPKKGFQISVAKEKWIIAAIGILAAALSVIGFVGDLFLEMHRFGYPPWSDSMGIPLTGVPFTILIFLGWWAVNLIGLKGSFALGSKFKELDMSHINYWYLTLTILTLLLTMLLVYEGDFWWTAAGIAWAYFYFQIGIGKMNSKINSANIL